LKSQKSSIGPAATTS